MRSIRLSVLSLILLLTLTPACGTPVPARVTMQPYAPIEAGAPIYVTAARQGQRVTQSLQDAGLTTTELWKDANYTLTVNVGASRGSGGGGCGTVNNVIYTLRANGAQIMVIKGRGLTGTCTPNIFDGMSQKLAEFSE